MLDSQINSIDAKKIDFSTIDNFEKLKASASEIDDFILSNTVVSSVYHQSDYLLSFFKNTPSIMYWEVLIARINNRIISVSPVYIKHQDFPIKFSVYNVYKYQLKALKFVGGRISFTENLDDKSRCQVINQHISTIHNGFDLAYLEAIQHDDYLFKHFKEKNTFIVSPAASEPGIVHRIDFPHSWDVYLASMTKKRRYNLKRNIRILKDEFKDQVMFKVFQSSDDVEVFYAWLDQIYSKTWQSKTMGHKKRLGTHDQIFDQQIAQSGSFLSYILFVENSAVAFVRGYLHKGDYNFEEIGFDQGWSKYNVGNVLNMMMLEHLMSLPFKVNSLDFGYGDNVYKQVFGNKKTAVFNIYFYKAHSKAHFILLQSRFFNRLYLICKSIIEASNLTHFVRKIVKNK